VAVALLAGGASVPLAPAPVAAAAVPANAVSELDENGKIVASVPVGTNPTALAYGGGALWVLNAGDNTVQRINPSTHAVEQTIAVGQDPRGIAITGDDLWVTSSAERTVTRINIETNELVDEIEVGTRPDAIAAGPAGLWVANSGDNTIQRIDTTTGVPNEPIYVDDGPDGLAVDEASVWVAHGRSGTVLQIDASTRERMSSSIPVGSGPRGILRAGQDVWVTNELSASVTRIDVDTRRAHPVDVGDGPTDLAVLGDDIWVAERYAGDLVRIDHDTSNVERFDLGAPVNGVTVVDGRLWVASGAFASASHLGGELRIVFANTGFEQAPWEAFDPTRAYDIWSYQASRILYDGLVALQYSSADPLVLVPDLADAVPTPTDGDRTYTFNLRPGIRYSDGTELRASDFVLGVQRALHVGQRPDWLAGLVKDRACFEEDVATCDIRSDAVVADDAAGRVTFHLEAPDPLFLYKLTLFVIPTPPGTPVGPLTSPLPGTGAYRIAAPAPGQVLNLTRNPWFQQWSPPAQPAGFPDTITWRGVPSAAEAVQELEQGRADLVDVTLFGEMSIASMRKLVERLSVAAPGRLYDSPVLGTGFLSLDSSRPPFDDLRARRALNFAVDRRKAIELGEGPLLARLTCQLMPPGMPSYRWYCPYTTGDPEGDYEGPDLDRARALVRASGTAGVEVDVGAISGDTLAPYVAEVLRSLDYRVTLRTFPGNQAGYEKLYDPATHLEVVAGGWVADYPAPSTFYDIAACPVSGTPVLPGSCDPEMDRRAAAASSLLRSDPGRALRAWTEIDKDLTDLAPFVAVGNGVRMWLTSERVGNYQNGDITPGPLLSQLWVL
jgi:YVTN family beta-propeller protein